MKFLQDIFKRDYREYLKRGDAHSQEKRWDLARIEYQKALDAPEAQEGSVKRRIQEKMWNATRNLAAEYVEKGDLYLEDRRWDLAIEAYQAAKDLYGEFAPEIDEIQEKLEFALEMHQEKILNESLEQVGLGDSLGVGFAELRRIKNFGLYQIAPYDDRFDDSRHFTDRQIADLKARLKLNPEDPDLHFDLGMIYVRYGFLSKAIEEIKRVIQIDPSHAEAHFVLGNVYSDYGDLRQGIHFLEKSLSLDPNFAPAYYYLGRLYEKSQNLAKAEEMYLRFIKLNAKKPDPPTDPGQGPDSPGEQAPHPLGGGEGGDEVPLPIGEGEGLCQGYLALSNLYKKRGEYLQAATVLRQYLLRDTTHEEVYAHLGELYSLLGDLERASECWERVIELEPESDPAREAKQRLKELSEG